MKTLKILLITALVTVASCKKEKSLELDCTSTTTENYGWTLESAEHVTRKTSDNSIIARTNTTSVFFNYDHRFKAGIYSQATIGSGNFTQVGTYEGTRLEYNIGDGLVYYKTTESGKLILERILYSNDTVTYVTERNTFINK